MRARPTRRRAGRVICAIMRRSARRAVRDGPDRLRMATRWATVVPVRRKRVISVIGAVVFAGLAVTFVLRGGTLDLVMAVIATAVAVTHAYIAITAPKRER